MSDIAERVKTIVTEISVAKAGTLLPNHYTGFVPATHDTYRRIEEAGLALGKIKPK